MKSKQKRPHPKVQNAQWGEPFFHLLECFSSNNNNVWQVFYMNYEGHRIIRIIRIERITYTRECATRHSCKGHGSKKIYSQVLIRKSENNDRYLFFLHFQLLLPCYIYIYTYIMLCVGIAYLPRQGYCVWIHYRV